MSDTHQLCQSINNHITRIWGEQDNDSLYIDMKKEAIYQKRWIKKKTDSGWKWVCWLLPPDVQLPLSHYRKYLMENFKSKML